MELNIFKLIWITLWSILLLSIPIPLISSLEEGKASITSTNPSSPSSNVQKSLDLFNLPKDEDEVTKSIVASVSCSSCNEELTRDGDKHGRGNCCIYASFSRCLVTSECHTLDSLGIEYAINHTANLYGCKDGPITFFSFHCLIIYYWVSIVVAGVLFLIFAAMLCIKMAMRKPTW